MNRSAKRVAVGYAVTLCSAILLWFAVVSSQPVMVLALPDGSTRTVFFSSVVYWLRHALTVGVVALPVAVGLLAHRLRPLWGGMRWAWMLQGWPLALLVPGVLPFLWPDALPPLLASNLVLLFPLLALSLTALNVADNARATWLRRVPWWGWITMVVAVAAVLSAIAGLRLAERVGPHSGDEAHYFVMAESLWQDVDLDLKNDIAEREQKRLRDDLLYYHISPRSRDGHWYSHHPFGLSLLLAPWVPFGLVGRHLVLGLIAGFGVGGLILLCRTVGASARAIGVVCTGFLISSFWLFYAARCVPEALGATLTIWAFWAMLSQERRGWGSALVAGLCLAYLPWAHVRFAPHALVGAGFYALFSLAVRERWVRRMGRVAVTGGLFFLSLVIYVAVQRALFSGSGAYNAARTFFWLDGLVFHLADGAHGLLIGFPAALWILTAQVPALFHGRRQFFTTCAAVAMLMAMYIPCATSGGYGAVTHPGRYFFAVFPLLVPCAALVWGRSQRFTRWWFIFLAMISFVYLLFLVWRAEPGSLWYCPQLLMIESSPFLRNLLNPFHRNLEGPEQFGPDNYLSLAWLALAIGLTALFHWPALAKRTKTCALLVVGLFLFGGVAHRAVRAPLTLGLASPGAIEWALSRDLGGVHVSGVGPDTRPISVFDVGGLQRDLARYTNDPGQFSEGTINHPDLPANDWAGRDYRWATLWGPVPLRAGDKLLRMTGRARPGVASDPALAFALRQGTETLYEGLLDVAENGRVDFALAFRSDPDDGRFLLLMRIEEGVGTFDAGSVQLAPYSPAYAEAAKLVVPAHIHASDAAGR